MIVVMVLIILVVIGLESGSRGMTMDSEEFFAFELDKIPEERYFVLFVRVKDEGDLRKKLYVKDLTANEVLYIAGCILPEIITNLVNKFMTVNLAISKSKEEKEV